MKVICRTLLALLALLVIPMRTWSQQQNSYISGITELGRCASRVPEVRHGTRQHHSQPGHVFGAN